MQKVIDSTYISPKSLTTHYDSLGELQKSRAFPNAYLETDEPPDRFPREKVMAIAGLVGTAYFGLTILILSLIDSEFSPIGQAASDYGVGSYALEMNVGFFVGGVGLLAFALAIFRSENLKTKAGSVAFFIASLMLFMDSYFTTNIEGGAATLHGTIHGFGGLVFFITAPIGVILVSRKLGRADLGVAVLGLVVGFLLLAVNAGLSGLAERIILLVIFSTVIIGSVTSAGLRGRKSFGNPKGI